MRVLLMSTIAILGWASNARAAYTVTFSQIGTNVVATGSGSINLGALTFLGVARDTALINPSVPLEVTGNAGDGEIFQGQIVGPSTFGTGFETTATTSVGDQVGFNASTGFILVPLGYVSESQLSETATYLSQSLLNVGALAGSYVYNFGSGPAADTFTVQIVSPSSVSEPATLALLGVGLAGMMAIGQRRSRPR